MYIVKRTYRRTDTTTTFFEDVVFDRYQTKMYGKTMAHNHFVEEDNCKRNIQVFFNEEQYQRWADDPMVRKFMIDMTAYNKENNISFNEIRATV
jgi:hypothetical protein